MTKELSDKHYEEHVDKDFYPSLREFILSGNAKHVILIHPIGRKYFVDLEEYGCKIPELMDEIKLIESFGSKVIGVGLNEENATVELLNKHQATIENTLNIPVEVPLSNGVEKFVNYIINNILK